MRAVDVNAIRQFEQVFQNDFATDGGDDTLSTVGAELYWASIVNPFGRYRWRSEDIFASEKIARQMIEQFDDLSISRSEYQRLAAAQIARDAVLSVASTRK